MHISQVHTQVILLIFLDKQNLNEIHNAWNSIDDDPDLLKEIFELDKRKFEFILNYK